MYQLQCALNNCFKEDISNLADVQLDVWLKDTSEFINKQEHTTAEQKKGYIKNAQFITNKAKQAIVDNAFALAKENEKKRLQTERTALEDNNIFESSKTLLSNAIAVGGNVDLTGKDDLKNKREKLERTKDYFKNPQNSLDYSNDFNGILNDISTYNTKNDKSGIQLRELTFRSQNFTPTDRLLLLKELERKANNVVINNWSTDATNDFYNTIDDKIQWYNANDGKLDEVQNRTEFIDFRDSIVNAVKGLNLSPVQAKEYLNTHPIYMQLVEKKAFDNAVDFLKGVVPNSDSVENEKPAKKLGASANKQAPYLGYPIKYNYEQ